jgi:hypothetical protein
VRWAVLLVCLGWPAVGQAADPIPYPEGDSTQVIEGHECALRIPKGLDRTKTVPLILTLGGPPDNFDSVAADEYVVCSPRPRVDRAGRMWSAGEVKEVWAIVDRLVGTLPIDPARLHAVAVDESIHSIFAPVVFGDGSRFVSATFVRSHFRGGSVAARARKALGVLAFRWRPDHGEGTGKILEQLEGKVRTVELREDAQELASPYFAWWLRTMEGRFVPGDDLSFDWLDDVASAEDLKARMTAASRRAFVYVFSKEDAASKDSRLLHTETLLDPRVRKAGRALLAVKVDRVAAASWVGAFGVKVTPALVVLKADGSVAARLEGSIKAPALAKALEEAAPK